MCLPGAGTVEEVRGTDGGHMPAASTWPPGVQGACTATVAHCVPCDKAVAHRQPGNATCEQSSHLAAPHHADHSLLQAGPSNFRSRTDHCICSTTAFIGGHEHCDCVAVLLLRTLMCSQTRVCVQVQSCSPNVQHHNLHRVHENCGHVARVLLVPAQAHEGRALRRLIDDGGVLLVSACMAAAAWCASRLALPSCMSEV